jgi:hypothetical protein
MAHAPFFAAAGKDFFELEDWGDLPDIKDLPAVFDAPRFARWNSFRESPNARYVGLTLPGFCCACLTARKAPLLPPPSISPKKRTTTTLSVGATRPSRWPPALGKVSPNTAGA